MREAFERALEKEPLDHTTRGVFADWLEENGFDDEALLERDRIVGLRMLQEIAAAMNAAYPADELGADDEYVTDRAITVEVLIEAGKEMEDGNTWCFGRDEDPSNFRDNLRKFWVAWPKAVGKPAVGGTPGHFRCAC